MTRYKIFAAVLMLLSVFACPALAKDDYYYYIDFNDYPLGSVVDERGIVNLSEEWDVSGLYLGDVDENSNPVFEESGERKNCDKLEVVYDETINEKVLKITKGPGKTDIQFSLKLPDINSTFGVPVISFETKAVNHSKKLYPWPSLSPMTGGELLRVLYGYNNLYVTQVDNKYTLGKLLKNVYCTVDMELRFAEGKATITNRNGTTAISKETNIGNDKIVSLLKFKVVDVGNNTPSATNGGYDATGDGVYYIRRIYVKVNRLKASSTSFDGMENFVGISDDIFISFNNDLLADTVNSENVILYSGDNPVNGYTVSPDGARGIKLSFAEPLNYNQNYRLKVTQAVKSSDIRVMNMPDSYSVDFKTGRLLPDISGLSDGEVYSESVSPVLNKNSDYDYETELVKDGVSLGEFKNGTISDYGSYTLKVKMTNRQHNRSDYSEISFRVVGQVEPFANDVAINGLSEWGETLTGGYIYRDYNGDAEDKTKTSFRWLVSDTIDGEYLPLENETAKSLVLGKNVTDKYIKFEVTVYAHNSPQRGTAICSEPVVGLFRPIAKNVEIIGKSFVGSTISGKYNYEDINSDAELNTKFQWYIADSLDVGFRKIDGATRQTYKILEKDAGKYLKFEVIPCSEKMPFEGESYMSETFIGPLPPQALDLAIFGELKAGNTVYGQYTYYDPNGDAQNMSKTKYKWLADGIEVSDKQTLELVREYAGKRLVFSVIPASDILPYEGSKYECSAVMPGSKAGNGVVVGRNGGGGGGGGGKPVAPVTDIIPPIKPIDTKVQFNDISLHWAKDDIIKLVGMGIVNGASDTSFEPEGFVTRGQLAAMINRCLKLSTDGTAALFADVSDNDWYFGDITALQSNGIINGSNNMFRPEDYITRQELCVVLDNIASFKKLVPDNQGESSFADSADISEWAKKAVENVCAFGLMNGCENNAFKPNSNTTRAQTAVVINRLVKALEGE